MTLFGNRRFRNAPNEQLSESGEDNNLGEHIGEWVELGTEPHEEITLVTSMMPPWLKHQRWDENGYHEERGPEGEYHMPALDLDVEHAYWESTTPGHGALLLNVPMAWEDYLRLIDLLEELGIIQYGFAEATRQRGYSALRTPWTKKPTKDESDATSMFTFGCEVCDRTGGPHNCWKHHA